MAQSSPGYGTTVLYGAVFSAIEDHRTPELRPSPPDPVPPHPDTALHASPSSTPSQPHLSHAVSDPCRLPSAVQYVAKLVLNPECLYLTALFPQRSWAPGSQEQFLLHLPNSPWEGSGSPEQRGRPSWYQPRRHSHDHGEERLQGPMSLRKPLCPPLWKGSSGLILLAAYSVPLLRGS